MSNDTSRPVEAAPGDDELSEPWLDSVLTPSGGADREAAQGSELFEDPDSTVDRVRLRQGSPGHETLATEEPDDVEDRR